MAATHDVINQVPPLSDVNLYRIDRTLGAAVDVFDGGWGAQALRDYGALVGGELAEHGRLANRFTPELKTHDAYGHRIDEVAFHPSYHVLMRTAVAHGVHGLAWETPRGDTTVASAGQAAGRHVVRAGLELLHNQADSGTDCPLTMTYASIPALRTEPALADYWEPRIVSRQYDGGSRPYFEKAGLTVGMAMTEKQGGTDVRANLSRARPLNESVGGAECFALTGHKWFCSAPMSDGFLTLAHLDGGLTCFLMPRFKPDGARNAIFIQRLKDKLGNRSNASAEIEFDDAFAWRVGEPGRGVATIIQMVALTRFNCMVGSTALMRHAAIQARHHVEHRRVGGARLIEAPLMRNVVADLVLESEAALWMVMRVAHALDRPDDPNEAAFVRLATALGKYWICKRAPQHVNEAQECLGGLGYVEEHVLPRLYREAPVNSIWEGSGNVQCLDLLRALARSPETIDVFVDELAGAMGTNPSFDAAATRLATDLRHDEPDPFEARILAERMAVLLQAGLLIRHADGAVANAFLAARLGRRSLTYGALTDRSAVVTLLERISVG
jgi:putative acyl-CoA dehydrogenase